MTEEIIRQAKEAIDKNKKSKAMTPITTSTEHFAVSLDDTEKIASTIYTAVRILSSEQVKRVDLEVELVELGDDFKPLEVCGYWFGKILRVDIEVKS